MQFIQKLIAEQTRSRATEGAVFNFLPLLGGYAYGTILSTVQTPGDHPMIWRNIVHRGEERNEQAPSRIHASLPSRVYDQRHWKHVCHLDDINDEDGPVTSFRSIHNLNYIFISFQYKLSWFSESLLLARCVSWIYVQAQFIDWTLSTMAMWVWLVWWCRCLNYPPGMADVILTGQRTSILPLFDLRIPGNDWLYENQKWPVSARRPRILFRFLPLLGKLPAITMLNGLLPGNFEIPEGNTCICSVSVVTHAVVNWP